MQEKEFAEDRHRSNEPCWTIQTNIARVKRQDRRGLNHLTQAWAVFAAQNRFHEGYGQGRVTSRGLVRSYHSWETMDKGRGGRRTGLRRGGGDRELETAVDSCGSCEKYDCMSNWRIHGCHGVSLRTGTWSRGASALPHMVSALT